MLNIIRFKITICFIIFSTKEQFINKPADAKSWTWSVAVVTYSLPITRLPRWTHSDALVLGRCRAFQQWATSPPAAVCHRDVQRALWRLRCTTGIQWPSTLLYREVGQSHIITQVFNPVSHKAVCMKQLCKKLNRIDLCSIEYQNRLATGGRGIYF